ncbi:MAG: TVP38/TMEM64 family protein [Vicinamibacterales bacterium]
MTGERSRRASRWLGLGGAVAIASLALEGVLVWPIGQWVGALVAWVKDAGALGAVAYAVTYIVVAVLMLPASLLTAGAGFAYGPVLGTLLVSPVSILAATVAFLLGRTVARGWITRRTEADPRFRAVDAAVGENGFKIVLLLRLSPLFPFNVLNYALGLTRLRLRDYVLGSAIGMFPGTALYVYLGSLVRDLALTDGAARESSARLVLSVVGVIATAAATVVIARVARRALTAELEQKPPTSDPLKP